MELDTYYITGTLVEKHELQLFSEKFQKQEFVIHQDGPYEQYIKMMVVNTRIPQLNKVEVGDLIEVAFNIKGQRWSNPDKGTSGVNTNLQAFEIKKANHQAE